MRNKPSRACLFLSITLPALALFSQPSHAQETSISAQTPGGHVNVATLPGIELGGQVSNYRYQEHVVSNAEFMHETGVKVGITGAITEFVYQGFFVTGDVRFAYSGNDYSSASGKQDDIPDYLFETRAVVGKDLFVTGPLLKGAIVGISPYIGIGYRRLYNDSTGQTDLGVKGYTRESQYLYLPVGVTHRFGVSEGARISVNTEYDQLIEGWQTSNLNDASPAFPNIESKQRGGFGLRGSAMYERGIWSVGPFFNYWNINQSETAHFTVARWRYSGFEPHNQTLEYGVQARYHF
ncbi:hypothetical protein CWS72_09255 [Telmatospirillum siberiense]|uniref:Outer membrane protein beta-barrel domain-containing protein n=1 Tax=Telmatospirillum siberiense TaxID=382514 RepID=A0A2N3PWJ8_9PROT|nr:hypothetical protein CWS72_09255 [Telmatospirillum siberiense]